jgi:hypothetical protein
MKCFVDAKPLYDRRKGGKLDLYVLDGNLTGQKYRDNVLAPRVVPHFDNQEWQQFPKNGLGVLIILKDVTMTWEKWGSKQALETRKTSLSLMEVFNIALKCRVFRF